MTRSPLFFFLICFSFLCTLSRQATNGCPTSPSLPCLVARPFPASSHDTCARHVQRPGPPAYAYTEASCPLPGRSAAGRVSRQGDPTKQGGFFFFRLLVSAHAPGQRDLIRRWEKETKWHEGTVPRWPDKRDRENRTEQETKKTKNAWPAGAAMRRDGLREAVKGWRCLFLTRQGS